MHTHTIMLRHKALYIGVDVHKDTHTIVANTCFGETLFEHVISNSQKDFAQLAASVQKVSKKYNLFPVFGLEDSYGNGLRLARYLASQGLSVKMISPVLVDRERQYETHPEKNDSLDALGAARVLIQRIDTLPSYSITKQDEIAKEIRELALDREFLVKEQTRIKNQLHRLLHRAYNGEYRNKFHNPFSVKGLKYWKSHPIPKDTSDVVGSPEILERQMRRKVTRLLQIRKEVKELEGELTILIQQTGQQLQTFNGCGIVVTAKILSEIKDIARFHSPSSLAKYAGLCPREKSSGKSFKHVKTKSGNRQLNMALHRMALSQISRSGNKEAKEYFQRKISEGKTKSQALCCLKRRLVDIVYMMLKHQQPYQYTA